MPWRETQDCLRSPAAWADNYKHFMTIIANRELHGENACESPGLESWNPAPTQALLSIKRFLPFMKVKLSEKRFFHMSFVSVHQVHNEMVLMRHGLGWDRDENRAKASGKRKEYSSIVEGQSWRRFLMGGFAVLIAYLKFKLNLFPGSKGSIFRDNISF